MKYYQLPLPFNDPLLRLGQVEHALAKVFPFSPPSRPTIVKLIEEGILEGRKIAPGNYWHVYQSSLDQYIIDLTENRMKLAA